MEHNKGQKLLAYDLVFVLRLRISIYKFRLCMPVSILVFI